MDSLTLTTCASNFRRDRTSTDPIRYRVIEGDYDITLIVEGGYFGTITMTDDFVWPEKDNKVRVTILEWYESPVTPDVMMQLKTAIDGELHELPPIMNCACDAIKGIISERLQGFEPEGDFCGMLLTYLANESLAYYNDTSVPYDDPINLSDLFTKITGATLAIDGVEDEDLLSSFL